MIRPSAPPPPLLLPPPPLTPFMGPNSAAPAALSPTPPSGGAFGDVTDKEDGLSEANYPYLKPHHQPTLIQPVSVPALAPVPVAQPPCMCYNARLATLAQDPFSASSW